jgi:bla regulator protein blaR1
MSDPSGLGDVLTPLGFTLGHALWQTAALALGYAAWRALARRAKVTLRYRMALLALGLGLATAAATFWSLGSAADSAAGRGVPGASILISPISGWIPGAPARPAMLRSFDPAGVLDGLVVLWAGGVLVLSFRLLGGVLLAGQIRRRATPVERAGLLEAHRRLAMRLGMNRPVLLLQSSEVDAPVAVGWRRPAVLLPSALTNAEAVVIEPLLAHELAHVRARDYATNLVQAGLDVLLFTCPGARWLSGEVRRLREYRCDDRACALSDSPARYVRALATLAEARAAQFPAPAASGPRLVDRIRRLSEGEVMARSRLPYALALGAAAALMALVGSSLLAASRSHAALDIRPAGAFTPWVCPGPPRPSWVAPIRLLSGNEFVPQDVPSRDFYCNPVRLDGRPVDWQSFTVETRGTLTLVHGDPKSEAATPIAFAVSLRREGRLLDPAESPFPNRAVFSIDLGKVLSLARVGDELIIDPVNRGDWKAKRIITLGC